MLHLKRLTLQFYQLTVKKRSQKRSHPDRQIPAQARQPQRQRRQAERFEHAGDHQALAIKLH
jgi:hypothetical protein